jgi:integrase
MRAGELWALRVERVDFLRRTVSVLESVEETRGDLVTKPPKNGRVRVVRLDPTTVELLSRHVRDYPSKMGFLFTSPDDAQVRHRNFMRRHFEPAVARAGLPHLFARAQATGCKWCQLPSADHLGSFHFHDLRHSHASALIARGWRPEQVKERLGHGSIRTTMDWYGHLFEGHDDEQLVDLGGLVEAALS